MKRKKEEKTPIGGTRITDDKLSAYIKEQDDLIRAKHIKETAQKIGAVENDVVVKKKTLLPMLGIMAPDYNALIDVVDQKYQGEMEREHAKNDLETKALEDREFKEKHDALHKELTSKKAKLNEGAEKFGPEIRAWYPKLWILYIIAGSEVLLNFQAFSMLGGSILTSIGAAVLSAVLIFWYSHLVPDLIEKYAGDNGRKQIFLFLLSLIPIAILFYTFGIIRQSYMASLNPNQPFMLSPFIPLIINTFAYIICYWLIKQFRPSKKKRIEYSNYKKDKGVIDQLVQNIKQVENTKKQSDEAFRKKQLERKSILLLAHQLEEEIATKYEGCYDALKMELIIRNANLIPVFGDISFKDLPTLKRNYSSKTLSL